MDSEQTRRALTVPETPLSNLPAQAQAHADPPKSAVKSWYMKLPYNKTEYRKINQEGEARKKH